MTPDEARKKIYEQSVQDSFNMRNMLDEYRRDSGIPISQFIAQLEYVLADFKLMKAYLTPSHRDGEA